MALAGLKILDQVHADKTQKPLFRLNATIPKEFKDPRTFVLLNVLNGFSPKVLNTGACAAIVGYYWEFLRRRYQISTAFNFLQGIIVIIYTTVDLRIIELEVFFISAIFFQFSFEIIAIIRNPKLFFSHLDGIYGLIFKLLTLLFLIRISIEGSIKAVDPHYSIAPVIVFGGI